MQFDSKSIVRHDARAVYSTDRSMGDAQSGGARAISIMTNTNPQASTSYRRGATGGNSWMQILLYRDAENGLK